MANFESGTISLSDTSPKAKYAWNTNHNTTFANGLLQNGLLANQRQKRGRLTSDERRFNILILFDRLNPDRGLKLKKDGESVARCRVKRIQLIYDCRENWTTHSEFR